MSELANLPVYTPAKNQGSSVWQGVFITLAAIGMIVGWIGWPYLGYVPFIFALLCGLGAGFALIPEANEKADANVPPRLPREALFTSDQWFWVVLGLMVFAIAGATSFESNYVAGVGSSIAVILGVMLLHVLARLNVATFLRERWQKALILTFVYLAIGIGYSFFRYDIYVGDWRKGYDAAYARYESLNTIRAERGEAAEQWNAKEYYHPKPSFANDSGFLGRWVAFWPWSATHFLLSDFIVRALDWVVAQFSGVYDWIAERNMRDMKE